MKDTLVPPAPLGNAKPTDGTQSGQNIPAPRNESPLDAAFLSRIYRSMAVFGILMTGLAAFGWQTAPHLGSFVLGYVFAIVLLRLQEISMRTLMRPKEQLGGLDPKLGILLVLPLKFVAIGVVLVAFNMTGFLKPVPMAAGFFAAQLIIVAKLAGWWLVRVQNKK